MGFSMSVFMALMLAINIGVMVNKSLKESRRQKRLKEIKERKVDTFFELEELKSAHLKRQAAAILKKEYMEINLDTIEEVENSQDDSIIE